MPSPGSPLPRSVISGDSGSPYRAFRGMAKIWVRDRDGGEDEWELHETLNRVPQGSNSGRAISARGQEPSSGARPEAPILLLEP